MTISDLFSFCLWVDQVDLMKNMQDGRYLMQLDAMVEQLHEVRKTV